MILDPDFHKIKSVKVIGDDLTVITDTGSYTVDINKISPRLKAANAAQRNNCRYSSVGYGIHWPDIDEDLSVKSIIRFSRQ